MCPIKFTKLRFYVPWLTSQSQNTKSTHSPIKTNVLQHNKYKKTTAMFSRLLWHPAWKWTGPVLILALNKFITYLLTYLYALILLVGRQKKHPACKKNGGWWRWALVSPDGVVPSQMVCVSASVNLPLHHKVQKFSSGTGSPGWSWKKGHKMVLVVTYLSYLQPRDQHAACPTKGYLARVLMTK